MIVPEFDRESMSTSVHDFDSQPQTFSGAASQLGDAPAEALVNPRRIGFLREDNYIPIYWTEE
jgi:hypothetical protein